MPHARMRSENWGCFGRFLRIENNIAMLFVMQCKSEEISSILIGWPNTKARDGAVRVRLHPHGSRATAPAEFWALAIKPYICSGSRDCNFSPIPPSY